MMSFRFSTAFASIVVSLTIASCSVSRGANELFEGEGCEDGAACDPGERCFRGFCISVEGGTRDTDVGREGGLPCMADGMSIDEGVEVECYTGPEGTAGVGVCERGTQTCQDDRLTECAGEVTPSQETCNGKDDDCDGTVDNVGFQSRDCYTGPEGTAGVGVCRPGEQRCEGGALTACLGQVTPGIEVCNGKDDDCNGNPDDVGSGSCDTGEEGRCAEGEIVCRDGSGVCQAVHEPLAEECNGMDDDCDGAVDENSSGDGPLTRECYPADNGCSANDDGGFDCLGICGAGTETCTDGQFGDCEGATTPATEVCTSNPSVNDTAQDEDCDGAIDEEATCDCTSGNACYTGPQGTEGVGACEAGTTACTNGTTTCENDVTPEPETCENDNDTDDDCDGTKDNIEGRGDTCTDDSAQGVCRTGTMQCADPDGDGIATLTCVTPEPADMETCDGTDDDCDGTVDEGFDKSTDENHCGMCNRECGQGLTCCSGQCVNTSTSENHCSMCGESCGEGLTCCGGECVNTDTTDAHCGGCGSACDPSTTCCGGACVDTDTNPEHCDMCGMSCAAGEQCCGGTCQSECSECSPECSDEQDCCSGTCVDQRTSESHCGECGNNCEAGELCCGGECVPEDTNNCGTCGNDCSTAFCCGGECTPEDDTNCGSCGNSCGAGEQCCGGQCKNTQTNENHCGDCNEQCSMTCCSGDCVNTTNNDDHCGTCGSSCGAGSGCTGGDCRLLGLL